MTHYKSNLQAEFHYYPFGLSINLPQAFGAEPQPLLFTNQTFERNEFTQGKGLNLYDFEARTYDPQIGRWWQVDPLASSGIQASLSPYHYCYNNPINFNDPTGLSPDVLNEYSENYRSTLSRNGINFLNSKSSMDLITVDRKGERKALIENKPYHGARLGYWYEREYSETEINFDPSSSTHITHKRVSELYWDDAQSNGGLDGIERFGLGLGTLGFYYEIKGNALHNKLYWKGKTTGKIYTNNPFSKPKVGWKANSFNATGKAFQGAKALGAKLSVAGVLLTGADIAFGDGFTTSNSLDLAFGLAGFIPGVGWMISGSYFIVNTSVQLYSGKSIGEHLDD